MASVQTLRVDDADAMIGYGPSNAWQFVANSGESWNSDGTYHVARTRNSEFFIMFRGWSCLLLFPLPRSRHSGSLNAFCVLCRDGCVILWALWLYRRTAAR